MKNLIHLVFVIVFLISCKTDFKSLSKSENIFESTTITQLKDSNYSQKIENFYDSGTDGTFYR